MLRRFSVNFALFSMALDAVVVAAALALAVELRPRLNELPFAQTLTEGSAQTPQILYLLFPLFWVAVLLLFAVYDGRRNLRIVDELSSLTLGSGLAGIASAGALFLSFRDVSRLLFITFVVGAFLGLVLSRLALRTLQRLRGFSATPRRVLVVGSGQLGEDVRVQIEKHIPFGLVFIGFVDDRLKGKQVIGGLDKARQIVRRKRVDDVVFALPGRDYQRVNLLAAELHDLPVRTWVIPDYFSIALHRAQIDTFVGLPMLDLRAPALNDYQRLLKRAFDISLVVLVLPLILPLSLLIAVAIRFVDKGPVLFPQSRVGENGRVFTMLKFRTMRIRSHRIGLKNENVAHKRKEDPRVTHVGRFLRRTSMDEFPQLWNVLKGEMSLVGPRPELPALVERYEPWQRKRFSVPPGVTGWWQVNGRSDRPMHLHTEDDLYYVHHYSIGLDLFILLKTVWTVLSGRGAF